MIELLVSYDRPASLTESEFRSWLLACAEALADASAPLILEPGTRGDLEVLRLTVNGDPQSTSNEHAIGGLLGDMRMLGLRPTVLEAEDGDRSDANGRTPSHSRPPDPVVEDGGDTSGPQPAVEGARPRRDLRRTRGRRGKPRGDARP